MQKLKRPTTKKIVCYLWQICSRLLSLLAPNKGILAVFVLFVLLLLPLFSLTRVNIAGVNLGTSEASALAANNLNFQSRLQSSNGSIVPDGDYHVEFKLYDVSTGGTALWTETRTTGNLVRVVNGYLSVYLGDVTALPNTIPWDQQLYLTMNIGGTAGAPTWDGEMNPRLRLTAVPYAMQAMRASEIAISSGANLATLSIEAPTSGNQTFIIQDQGASGTYNILTNANAPTLLASDFIRNQNTAQQTANQWISGSARTDTSILTPLIDTATATALNIGTTNATSINLNQNTVLAAGKSITITGGNTASRPASPTEGMIYYDTTTKQLLTYSNGKWQADKSDAILVAASDSSRADKDAAQFVADGNTAAAADGDQVQINQALTAAAGKKVVLLAGTYTADATILIPNNTTLTGVGTGTLIQLADLDVDENLIENSDIATGTGVVVRDLRIDGQKSLNTDGVQRGIFFGNMGGGSGASARHGSKITNVQISNFRTEGVFLSNSNNNIFTGNTSQNNGTIGFYFPVSSNNLVSGNMAFGNGGEGFRFSSSSNNDITDNISQGNTQYGYYFNSTSSSVIDSNSAQGNGNTGIMLDSSSSNNTVTGNNLDTNGYGGIYVMGTSIRNSITGNIAKSNNNWGIIIASNDNTVSGNTVQSSFYGIRIEASNGVISSNTIINNGNSTSNQGIYLSAADSNTVVGNVITDSAATTTNYAITISNAASDKNYLADNVFSSTPGTSTIQDLGTGTVYSNQARAENGAKLTTRTANDVEAFTIQNATGGNIFTVDTTNSEVELGNSTTVGKLVLSDGSSNTVTISTAALAGNYTLTIPTITANDIICLQGLANCGGAGASTIGALDGGTANANGATISGTTLYLQSASATNPGLINTTTQTFAGAKTFNDNITLAAGKTINVTGGATATRPASPTEGMIYFDTTTKQLLTYSNGKWQADGKDAVIVAASNGSAADKASADYIAVGTNSDQVAINAALTAANPAGTGRKTGKVVLLAGTYTINASISIPNNTTLVGSGAGTVITIPNALNTNFSAITNTDQTTGADITIQDLRLEGNKLNQSGTGFGMSGIEFNGMGGGSGSTARSGVKIIHVRSNNWYSNGATGSVCQDGAGICLRNSANSTVSDSSTQGDVDGLAFSNVVNSVISGNTAQGNLYAGLYTVDSSDNTISNNVTQGNGDGLAFFTTSDSIVTGNIVKGSDYSGLYVEESHENIFSDNVVQENAIAGFNIATSSSNTISGNKVYDNGGTTDNNGIYLSAADSNNITNNTITDTSATTTNYAISISNSTADANYLADNTLGGGSINDVGTGTIFANQLNSSGILLNRSSGGLAIQNASGANIFAVDTTGSQVVLGNTTTTGKLVLSDGSSNTVTISVNALAGNYTLAVPTMTANDTLCLVTAANCVNGTMFIQNQNAAQQTANYWISGAARADTSVLTPRLDTATATALNIGTTNATNITIGNSISGINLISNIVNVGNNTGGIIQGAPQGVGANGVDLVVRGGGGGSGSANGGNITISGGDGTGTGIKGLVNISTAAYTTSGIINFGTSGTINSFLAKGVDSYSSVRAQATAGGLTLSVDAPSNAVIGRLLYLSNVGSNDFNILLAGTNISIALKPNSTATLVWNGNGWTAAGASSSTDLQSAYNNTLTSAGGAELVLNPSGGAADGLTIRNNGTAPITGGIFEVQSSIGTNIFSVNSRGTELASNGGAETPGAFATTFPANTWIANGSVVTRTSVTSQYYTGQAGVAVSTGNNSGVANNLTASPVLGATYQVSFTAKVATAGMRFKVAYSPTNGTNLVECTPATIDPNIMVDPGTANTEVFFSTTVWTKFTCLVTTSGSVAVTLPQLLITRTDGGSANYIYIDNLSFMRNDTSTQPSSVQIGGGVSGGQITLFTLDRSSAPPVANGDSTYYGSMYYDTTTGRIQCYEADGWGACGSAPDNIVVLTPEYSNAVMGGPGNNKPAGVGTMTAEFCANKNGILVLNDTLCTDGVARNYYKWTSPQPANQPQTYSIYVSYKLPGTFKEFYADDTIKLSGYRDSAADAKLELSIFRSTGAGAGANLYECGSKTAIFGAGVEDTWATASHTGNEKTDTSASCDFQAGEYVIFKIDMTAANNANVYVENLEFRYTNT